MTKCLHAPRNSARRGFAMAMALIAVAVLFFAAIVVLEYTSFSAANAANVQFKQAAFDAAEAGLNDGMRALDLNPSMTNGSTGNGGPLSTTATYTWTMVVNNLKSSASTTSGSMTVPGNTAYMTATASIANQRAETVGAIIGAAQGLNIPNGAIKAGSNIFDGGHAPINKAANGDPANVYANGNITTSGNPGTVQGSTYAAGSVNQWTSATGSYSNQPPVTFPAAQQDVALANTALALAKAGTTVQASSPTGTYTGNVYINGAVNLSNGTIQFNGGGTVYINGSVSISGHGAIVNQNGSLIVVNGTFATSGQGLLTVPIGSGGELMVLAADPSLSTCASGGGNCAVTITGNGNAVGSIFVPYGSVQMAGNGAITGAVAAGEDVVFSGGGSKGSFTYDPIAGTDPITASNYRILSYLEN
jgi:Tfp pilus assembly protein PilX